MQVVDDGLTRLSTKTLCPVKLVCVVASVFGARVGYPRPWCQADLNRSFSQGSCPTTRVSC